MLVIFSLSGASTEVFNPFDAQHCHMATATKNPAPDRVQLSFVIFDIRAF